jgi:hypothetical protein
MNKIGKILFPIAALIVTVTAISEQNWLRLGIAAIFVLATIRIFKEEAQQAEEAAAAAESASEQEEAK